MDWYYKGPIHIHGSKALKHGFLRPPKHPPGVTYTGTPSYVSSPSYVMQPQNARALSQTTVGKPSSPKSPGPTGDRWRSLNWKPPWYIKWLIILMVFNGDFL
jgi:hypothetical protein